jgi:hypothetical protein
MQGEKGMSSRFLDISSCNNCTEPDERSPPVMTRWACVEVMTRQQCGICLEVLCRLPTLPLPALLSSRGSHGHASKTTGCINFYTNYLF